MLCYSNFQAIEDGIGEKGINMAKALMTANRTLTVYPTAARLRQHEQTRDVLLNGLFVVDIHEA